MKVWLVSFVFIFGLAQFVLWVKDFFLPLPVYVLGGALLAIASNYDKGIKSFFGSVGDSIPQTATLVDNRQQNFQQSALPPSLQSAGFLPAAAEKSEAE